MILIIYNKLTWLKKNPYILKNIYKGIERESLRINYKGNISTTSHPKSLGSALTHKWITTDFAESLIEFITSIKKTTKNMLITLYNIHKYTLKKLKNELLWPMSMPCFLNKKENIKISKYGISKIGKIKNLYRKGLKTRYGTNMQIISGIHYNFSFSKNFWNKYIYKKKINKKTISIEYFKIIRNYYRFGWIITYLFGASPGICDSFFKKNNNSLFIKKIKNTIYSTYSTSLRLSDLGYKNKNIKNNIIIKFNSLKEYIYELKKNINTPCKKYKNLGIKKNNKYIQLNTNILQNENELYTYIRPKRKIKKNESLYKILIKKGVQYIEIRSIDINPFSKIGINEDQINFIDLFIIWCMLIRSPKINKKELININKNWNKIIIKGRKPNLKINTNKKKKKKIIKKNWFINT